MAPRAGFEPATCRLTVECSTAELPGNNRVGRGVSGVIQMLFRFAKRFFKKNPTCLFKVFLRPISAGNDNGVLHRFQWQQWVTTDDLASMRTESLRLAASVYRCRARAQAGSASARHSWSAAPWGFFRSSASGWFLSGSSSYPTTFPMSAAAAGVLSSGGAAASAPVGSDPTSTHGPAAAHAPRKEKDGNRSLRRHVLPAAAGE
jgi:hypothetical protein